MVKAAPQKLVITVLVALAAAAVITFAARPARDAVCFALLSPAEKKVVGEWKTYSIGGEIVTTIRADHTWTSIGGCMVDAPPLNGRWKVGGSDIIYSVDLPVVDDAPPPEPVRVPIQQLIDDDRQVRSWADHPAKKGML
jgi:hypothetical protein